MTNLNLVFKIHGQFGSYCLSPSHTSIYLKVVKEIFSKSIDNLNSYTEESEADGINCSRSQHSGWNMTFQDKITVSHIKML
jgi:hypothetical protein